MKALVFRAWDPDKQEMTSGWTIEAIADRGPCWRDLHWPIMQYTGITDPNGAEIYEGDILLVYESDGCQYCGGGAGKRYAQVIFDDDLGAFVTTGFPLPLGQQLNGVTDGTCIVVGNIHETPELLNDI